MSLAELNKKSIAEYLSGIGIKPVRKGTRSDCYLSPLQGEKNPSFHVYHNKNKWHCYSSGQGGSLIDLIVAMEGCSIYEAGVKLEGRVIGAFKPPEKEDIQRSGVNVHLVEDISNMSLINYAGERGISAFTLTTYCKQITFSFGEKPKLYIGIGFANQAGGWEIRCTSVLKIAVAPKCFSIIKLTPHERYYITEGFFDALSMIEIYPDLQGTIYVMNSTINITQMRVFLRLKRGEVWVDNDKPGDKIRQELNHWKDKRNTYHGYNDLNEMLSKNLILFEKRWRTKKNG